MQRLIVANLLAEDEWAEASGRRRGSARALPHRVRDHLARLATLLRAFARDGDTLWIPDSPRPTPLAPIEGLATPELVGGPLEAIDASGFGEIIAWGETAAVARLRALGAAASPRPRPSGTERETETRSPGEQWRPGEQRLDARSSHPDSHANDRDPLSWLVTLAAAPPSATSAMRANDRVARVALREAIGETHGARVVADEAALHAELSDRSDSARWVLKAPFSAAGRERVLGRGPLTDPPTRTSVTRLFASWDALVLEPWLDRVVDHAWGGVLDAKGHLVHGFEHRLETRGPGHVLAIELASGSSREEARESAPTPFSSVRDAVLAALREEGYHGAFVVDAFDYRDATGEVRPHRLVEVNARIGFGLVAHALRARLERAQGPLARFTLCLGDRRGLDTLREKRPAARVVELLAADGEREGPWALVE